jgi:hypothetical protein
MIDYNAEEIIAIATVKNMSSEQKDAIYRYLWTQHVYEDVENRAEETETALSEEQIDEVVEEYVYYGNYDCNLSYWDNIDNLIESVIENDKDKDEDEE